MSNARKLPVRIILVSIALLSICTLSLFARGTFSTEGTLVVLNKSDDTATLISLKNGSAMATLPTGKGPHEGVVSRDGKTLVVSNYGARNPSSLTVIDVEGKKVTKTITLGGNIAPHGIMYMPDGERVIATTERSRTVIIVNIKSGEVEQSISTAELPCHMVVVTPSGETAFATSIAAGAVSVLDLKKGEQIKTLQTGAGAEGIDISPGGNEVWVGNRAANTISIIDVESLEIVAILESESFPIRVKFTPDGRHVFVSNMRSNEVGVFDAATRKEIRRIPMLAGEVDETSGRLFAGAQGPAPIGILVHPNNKYAFIANTRADVVSVIDLKQWKVIARLESGREPDGMAFSCLTIK